MWVGHSCPTKRLGIPKKADVHTSQTHRLKKKQNQDSDRNIRATHAEQTDTSRQNVRVSADAAALSKTGQGSVHKFLQAFSSESLSGQG